jgi:hypothetical protein
MPGFNSFLKGVSNIMPDGANRQQERIGLKNDMMRKAKRDQIGWDNLDIEQQKAWVRNPENELWTILTTEEEAVWKYKAGLGWDPNNRGMSVVSMRNSTDRRGGTRTRTKSRSKSRTRTRTRTRARTRSRSRTGGRK